MKYLSLNGLAYFYQKIKSNLDSHTHANKSTLDATEEPYTAADKSKLDGVEDGANKTTVDAALSSTSTNPVQNKAVTAEFNKYLPLSGGTMTGTINSTAVNFLINTVNGYKTIFRSDDSNFYILVSDKGGGSFNDYRPLTLNFSTGALKINGNAATATKLKTARNINGVPFDGSKDINVPLQGCYTYDAASTWSSTPWHKVASVTLNNANINAVLVLYVNRSHAFIPSASGILRAAIRSGSTIGSFNSAKLSWDYASVNIDLNNFVLVYTADASSGLTAELWAKHTTRYESWQFRVLSMSGTTTPNNDLWTLYNSTSGETTYTEGTGAVTSTLSDIEVPTYFYYKQFPATFDCNLAWSRLTKTDKMPKKIVYQSTSNETAFTNSPISLPPPGVGMDVSVTLEEELLFVTTNNIWIRQNFFTNSYQFYTREITYSAQDVSDAADSNFTYKPWYLRYIPLNTDINKYNTYTSDTGWQTGTLSSFAESGTIQCRVVGKTITICGTSVVLKSDVPTGANAPRSLATFTQNFSAIKECRGLTRFGQYVAEIVAEQYSGDNIVHILGVGQAIPAGTKGSFTITGFID